VRLEPALVRRLHARAGAERWGVSAEQFGQALTASADRAFAGKPAATDEVERYLDGLHLDDLALATACLAGCEEPWEHLVKQYRPALYRAADTLDPSGGAREIADALYGELFGAAAAPERKPLLRYYHGRSTLGTWLRSVLAQRVIDRVRVTRREQALPDDDSQRTHVSARDVADPERERHLYLARMALAAAFAVLDARDRLRIASYYVHVHGLTLAQIGRLFGEHEATASRQLAKLRAFLRADVERRLRTEAGLAERAVAECLASVSEDAGTLDLRDLLGPDAVGPGIATPRKKALGDRSKREQRV
jgi:RNA polymerase sigma factor (sigma-70 family)